MSNDFAPPTLSPLSTISKSLLPPTGNLANVQSAIFYSPFVSSSCFISGAVDQVAYTYSMLGGQVLGIELTEQNVYVAFESAVKEYGYLINLYQAKNSLSSYLGSETGTFCADGEFDGLPSGSALSGGLNPALVYPKITFNYVKTIQDGFSFNANLNSTISRYSASINLEPGVQDYDLQSAVYTASLEPTSLFYNRLTSSAERITVTRVFYQSPHSFWRFFGLYGGGLNTLGNLQSYGQFSDDSTFELVPVWQNIAQATMYNTAMKVRASNYSYELKNNRVRIFPAPTWDFPRNLWFEFYLDKDLIGSNAVGPNAPTGSNGQPLNPQGGGVNNLNTLPFANIHPENINSIGWTWIRRWALAEVKQILSLVRGKLSSWPYPGESITLNAEALYSQSQTEKEMLREELKQMLDETSYVNLSEQNRQLVENALEIGAQTPLLIYRG